MTESEPSEHEVRNPKEKKRDINKELETTPNPEDPGLHLFKFPKRSYQELNHLLYTDCEINPPSVSRQ